MERELSIGRSVPPACGGGSGRGRSYLLGACGPAPSLALPRKRGRGRAATSGKAESFTFSTGGQHSELTTLTPGGDASITILLTALRRLLKHRA
jgi:hypothetical protein